MQIYLLAANSIDIIAVVLNHDSLKETENKLLDQYDRVLSIPKDEHLELNLKKQFNSCFVYNYIDVNLKVWQANLDI